MDTFAQYSMFFVTNLIAMAMFAPVAAKRERFYLWFFSGIGVILAVCAVMSVLRYYLVDHFEFDIVGYTVVAVLTFFMIYLCWAEKITRCIYNVIAGTLLRNAGSKLVSIIFLFADVSFGIEMPLTLTLILVSYIPVYFLIGRGISRDEHFDVAVNSLIIIFVFMSIMLYSAYFEPVLGEISLTAGALFRAFEAFLCYMVISFQYVTYVHYKKLRIVGYENELKDLRLKQLDYFQGVIDVMNIKCHDLKHQIRSLASGQVSDEVLKGLESTVADYEAFVKTGSTDIDTILTEKKLVCISKNITLNCMVDGEALDFLSVEDKHALFGNGIDNAIEYLETLDDVEKRFVKVITTAAGAFLKLSFENYCEAEIVFNKKGLPETVKKDKLSHGFGTASMKSIAEKYGGNITFNVANDLFSVILLFPGRGGSSEVRAAD